MKTTVETEFVDRENIIQDFIACLEEKVDQRILMINGRGGMGKSWLMEYLAHICQQRNFPYTFIDFRSGGDIDYLSAVTGIRYGTHSALFQDLRAAIGEHVTKYRTLVVQWQKPAGRPAMQASFGSGNTFSGSFSEIALGGDVIKVDVSIPGEEIDRFALLMQQEITEAFLTCLSQLPLESCYVLLIDSVDDERCKNLVAWIKESLIPAMSEERLKKCIIVIGGQNVLEWERKYRYLIKHYPLEEFERDICNEYFMKLLGKPLPEAVFEVIFSHTGGHPLSLSSFADTLLQVQKQGHL